MAAGIHIALIGTMMKDGPEIDTIRERLFRLACAETGINRRHGFALGCFISCCDHASVDLVPNN